MLTLFAASGHGFPTLLLFLGVFAVPFILYHLIYNQLVKDYQKNEKKDKSQVTEIPPPSGKPETGAMPAHSLPTTSKSTSKTCPISREWFGTHAKAIPVVISGQQLSESAQPKEFSTKSIGWVCKGKVTVEVNGNQLPCWVQMNLTVIGSKNLPTDDHTGIEPVSGPRVGGGKQNVDPVRDQLERQRYWNKCLKKIALENRTCGDAVAMYYERFHKSPKGLRYAPNENEMELPVRVFVPHWHML